MKPQQKQKLELTWIGKGDEPKLEPRILIEQPDLSYGDPATGNMLIQGDNLLALKALEQDFAGKVKCIYIDPPYNTGSAFEHYDDGLEHSQWLNLMVPRLRILRNLLSEDGSIWVSIDDNEVHYLKVIMDEIFGRSNFLTSFIWKKSYGGGAKSRWFVGLHEYVLCYTKNMTVFPDMFWPPDPESESKYYKLFDEKKETRGPFRLKPLEATKSMERREKLVYPIPAPDGTEIWPKRQWWWSKERTYSSLNNNELYFLKGKDGSWSVQYKQYLKDEDGNERQRKPTSIIDGPYTQDGTKESIQLFSDKSKFAFPKPEGIVRSVIEACTQSNDIILDSFLGSGTTAAVAHKMGRRYIGIELGDHARTHCQPRLKKVVDGSDQGGISKVVGWQGGGGFRFFTLAPSLLNKDRYGHWVISEEYNPDMLAAAMAKQEGFRYQPDEAIYWKQARSSEKDFLFTTTAFLTAEMLDGIHDEMQPEESLLIACKAFQQECRNRHANISIKKIPHMLLGRCEFGREDYSLNIVQVPVEESPDELAEEPDGHPDNDAPARSVQTNLFD